MSRAIATLIYFNIEVSLEELANIFDSKETDRRHSNFDIKPLYRGFSNNDAIQKYICIYQAPNKNIQKFVKANSKWINSYKVDFSTME